MCTGAQLTFLNPSLIPLITKGINDFTATSYIRYHFHFIFLLHYGNHPQCRMKCMLEEGNYYKLRKHIKTCGVFLNTGMQQYYTYLGPISYSLSSKEIKIKEN